MQKYEIQEIVKKLKFSLQFQNIQLSSLQFEFQNFPTSKKNFIKIREFKSFLLQNPFEMKVEQEALLYSRYLIEDNSVFDKIKFD